MKGKKIMKISEMSQDEAISAGVELEWAREIYCSVIVEAVETNDEWISKAETKNLIAEISEAYKLEDKETYTNKVLELRWNWFTKNMMIFEF